MALASLLLATALWGTAVAQHPLTTPHYYAFQLPVLEVGSPLHGALEQSDGQNFKDGSRLDLYALNAVRGESYLITVTTADFAATLSVFDPGGTLVAFNDYGEWYAESSTTFQATEDGRHLVVVSGWSEFDLGSYSVTLADSSRRSESTTAVTLPAQLTSTITLDMAPAPGGYGGGAEHFSFHVDEPLLLLASMSSDELDSVLTLFDERGELVASNDDHDGSTDAQLVALLQPGDYVITASAYFAGESGEYTLRLQPYFER